MARSARTKGIVSMRSSIDERCKIVYTCRMAAPRLTDPDQAKITTKDLLEEKITAAIDASSRFPTIMAACIIVHQVGSSKDRKSEIAQKDNP